MPGVQKAPVRHHYLPEFFQRRWVGNDGCIERYQKFGDAVVRHRVFPAATGYKKDLYRHPRTDMDEWSAQAAEWGLFQRIDDWAADALEALLSEREAIRNDTVRERWAIFMRALLLRTPFQLEGVLSSLEEIWKHADVSERYAEMRKPGMPATANEFLEGLNPGIVKESAFRMFVDAVGQDRTTRYITSLPWRIMDCSRAKYGLLLSDHPVVLVPLRTPDGQVAMPLSPTKLLLVAGNPEVQARADLMTHEQAVRIANRLTVERAAHCVVSSNKAQDTFIRRYFGTNRIPPFISPRIERPNSSQ
ncbi:DUF4238 domain-containing protein [Pseudoblastomonas halimionae]|uniref:DUF4238 domain-containing protein n=1 Tax=Alteriqipengyuania halimionae TaxID=1926630 RepID=A0A6I4U695_9SPHN|nr:DUF4238 domain-containing protein [Alteriqipengyuania halimionae]MXP09951.1 DUF4238 domain-containing protein [Alteriqipengyuania halimionae]